ncbi:MAG: hypothetical protein ABI305_10690 [Tepidiformaceae bacterium]
MSLPSNAPQVPEIAATRAVEATRGAQPTASSQTAVASQPTSGPRAATATTPGAEATTALSDEAQIALQRQLEQQGKIYLQALQAQDVAAVSALLAGRCEGTDVAALITRRRAEITSVADVPIDQLTPLNQYVGHFDPFAGEAHTILQLDYAGTRVELPTADGWLLQNGAWKSVNC